jgi:hypothetical protein
MTKETIYTGDYGLSDCLFVNEEALDFADSFCKAPSLVATVESLPITEEDSDFPF